jgi:TrwC relaxase/AAA domain
MILTTRTGSAGAAGCAAYAQYVAQSVDRQVGLRAAGYYDTPDLALKADLSPEFAARLGIDRNVPLTVEALGNLLNNRTAGGEEIVGRKKHSPHQSVASVFGLDPKQLPTVAEIENVLAGRRADGDEPRDGWGLPDPMSRVAELGRDINAGTISHSEALDSLMRDAIAKDPDIDIDRAEERLTKVLAKAVDRADIAASGGFPLKEARVESAVRAFKAAIGVPRDRDATPEEIQRVADGRIDVVDYQRRITATNPPTAFIDMTFSVDKSISVAYALAPTEAERAIILDAVRGAYSDGMAYAQEVLGWARRGAQGETEERAEMAYVAAQHFTTRPTVDVKRTDADGREFAEPVHVPGGSSDVQLHQHTLVLSSVLTADGHVGTIDLSKLDGELKVIAAVGGAGLATRLREHGVDVTLGPNGEARIADVPEWVRQFNSRRATQGVDAAREWAQANGKSWDAMTDDQKAKFIDDAIARERQQKPGGNRREDDEGPINIAQWKQENEAAGYRHRSVLRPGREAPQLSQEQRIELARQTALPLLDEAFQHRPVISMGDLREVTARGLIVAGLGTDANADINAVIQTFKDRGVTLNGEWTSLVIGTDVGENRRAQTIVTTDQALTREGSLLSAVREAAQDRSMALTPDQVAQAAERFLAAHPRVDPNGTQWRDQLTMAHQIGEGGRVSLSIGVAGSGKTSSVVATLVDAWHADGRTVYGMTVPWRATDALKDAGVDQALAIDAFVRRVQTGQIKLDSHSVIVADEVSQLSVRHQTDLMRLVKDTGAQLVEIGDPRQTQAVEWPAIELMAKAIGDDNIPKLLTTIRQKTERDIQVATMFRDGQAAEGLAALKEDGRFHLVPGGTDATIKHTTELWRRLTDANRDNPDHSLLTIAPTNSMARQIGIAIRDDRISAGEIGETAVTLKARDKNSGETYDLPVSVGDKLRMFTRAKDADAARGSRSNLVTNGDIVEVLAVRDDGLRVRKADGVEGRLTWAQMKPWRAPKNDPVMLTYGYATTPDTAQSLTRSSVIFAMPEGSRQVTGHKNYTAMSRHETEAHMVLSQVAEWREIVGRQKIGQYRVPTDGDVFRNIAANLGRFEVKSTATDAMRRAANVQRGTIGRVMRAGQAVERQTLSRQQGRAPSRFEGLIMAQTIQRAVQRSIELTRERTRDVDRGLGLSR